MKRIVLVGPGHAHLFVLESYAKEHARWSGAELVLVSIEPVQHYSGMLSGHLAGDYPEEALSFDLAAICRGVGARLVTGGATELNVAQRFVRTARGEVIDFDLLSVDIGSASAEDRVPGVEEYAFKVKPIHRALELREVLDSSGPMVIAGGGVGGVELALCIRARARRPVHLVSPEAQLPAGADPALVSVVERQLKKRGITWTPNARVTQVEQDHVMLSNGQRLESEHTLWITGSRAPTIFQTSGAALDSDGYLRVYDSLQSTSHDYLFAAGDSAGFATGRRVQKSGVYSVRQGPILAHNLRERLTNGPLLAYEPQESALSLLNCGDGTAIGSWRGFAAHGRWLMRLKDRIDRRFMERFQSLGERKAPVRIASLEDGTLRPYEVPPSPYRIEGTDWRDEMH